MQSNVKDGVLFRSPRDEAERASVAGACVRKLGIKFPALIDGFDNRVESAYTGWPDGKRENVAMPSGVDRYYEIEEGKGVVPGVYDSIAAERTAKAANVQARK